MLEWFVPSCINHNKYKLIPQEMFVPIYKVPCLIISLFLIQSMFVSPTVLTVGANLFFIQAVAPLLILLLAIIREVTKFNNVQG